MMKKLNNKGFTLVEVLAVLVILSAIMGIALPSITSSMERNKDKQDESKKEMLASFAEIYVADHRNSLYNWMSSNGKDACYIEIDTLSDAGLLSDGADINSNEQVFDGGILFNKSDNTYKYITRDKFSTYIKCDLS